MSETYLQAIETASSTLGVQTSPQAQTIQRVPIAQFLPILKAIYSTTLYMLNLSLSLIKPFLILSPVPIFLYVFAPLLVFLQLVLATFILSPYKIALYLLDALYPLYVLCGVACIMGGILGLAARFLSTVLVNSVLPEQKEEGGQDEKGTRLKAEEDSKQVDVKGKGKKVERVKFES